MSNNEKDTKKREIIKKIDALAKTLGFDHNPHTIYEIRKKEGDETNELTPIQGVWSEENPMFAIDQDDPKKVYVFMNAKLISAILNMLQQTNQENFNLKLEKAIYKHVPVDFEDVRVVAMEKIKEKTKALEQDGNQPLRINLDELIADIKKEHPSLFVDLGKIFTSSNSLPPTS